MKIWKSAEIEEIRISSTNNQPTSELKADDIITGVGYKQGASNGSGPEYEIPYFPGR